MKTVYEKLRNELLKPYVIGSGLGNKFNKLIKIQLETDDDVLITGINNIMEHLKEANRLKLIKMYQKSSQEAEIATNLMGKLATYCKIKIESQEPEWMIIARQNGWTPPNETM